MKRILIVLMITSSTALFAQNIAAEKFSLDWNRGQIIFKTGDTLTCNLRFNQTADKSILQINEEGHTLTVPTKDVRQFSFFDARKNRKRIFTAFLHPHFADKEFYMEKIYVDNRFCILNHKTMEVPAELNFSRFVGKPIKIHKKYLMDEATGKLLPLSRESLLALLEPKRTEILSYVKAHHIRFRRIADFISVFQYHNSL
jgi:hypothetical protein